MFTDLISTKTEPAQDSSIRLCSDNMQLCVKISHIVFVARQTLTKTVNAILIIAVS